MPLNSGTNLRLSAGEVSDKFHDVELTNNPKIEKLRLQRSIAIETQSTESIDAPASTDAAPAETARPRKKT